MRVGSIGVLVVMAGCAVASAEPRRFDHQSLYNRFHGDEEALAAAQKLSEEAAARQAVIDERIAARSRKALRSVCEGCDTVSTRAPTRNQRRDAEAAPADEGDPPIPDPALAPSE